MDRRALDEFIERARGMRRRRELDAAAAAALDAFEARDVQSLLLKGPALARELYDEGESRGYADIDLLVAPRDLEESREALLALGYVRADEAFRIDDVAGVLHSELWAQSGKSGPLWVDLHWRLAGCEAPGAAVWASLAARQGTIDLAGREVPVPGTGGLALHLALHAASGGPRDLKAIADLARGVERWGPEVWRSAARLAAELDATPAFAAGLRLLPSGAVLANRLALPETRRLEWEIRHREGRPRGTFHLRALARARGWPERADMLRRSLLPTREWITGEFRWAAESKPRLLAAYACHLLRAPAWALRARRFRRRADRDR
jgi:hypothetical protein